MSRIPAIIAVLCGTVAVTGAEEKVTKREIGKSWPFTVNEGVLACDGSKGFGAVTFRASGVTYAVNGIAMGRKRYADVDKIWEADPSGHAPRKNIGEIIDRGLKLCK